MSEVREPPVDCLLLLPSSRGLTFFPPFLTETTQGRRMGYGFETKMSGILMANALVLVPLLTSLSVNLQVKCLSSP